MRFRDRGFWLETGTEDYHGVKAYVTVTVNDGIRTSEIRLTDDEAKALAAELVILADKP